MTVPFTPPRQGKLHRDYSTFREDLEPALNELLDDPTLRTLMARDGVERAALERLIAATQGRLRSQGRSLPASASFEASLFAECRIG